MLYYGIVLPDGTELEMDKEDRHYKLAEKYLKEHGLWQEYERSDEADPLDFLVFHKGAVKVGNKWKTRILCAAYPVMCSKTQDIIDEYTLHGFSVDWVTKQKLF